MFNNFLQSLHNGFLKIKKNPQLLFSVFVAFAIVVSFSFVVNRFINIAQKAQDNLMNIRIGFLLESFIEFAPEKLQHEDGLIELQNSINRIISKNQSINNFRIVIFEDEKFKIVSDLDKSKIGLIEENSLNLFLYNIAKINSNESYTIENSINNERAFSTVRIFKDGDGFPAGAILIEQSLSEADLKITKEINQSVVIFVLIIILIMFLFFRHARIIDYTTLYKKLKEVDQLKDDFISMASHELRTPLSVIRGYAEELYESEKIPTDLKNSAQRIDVAAKQLDNLVSDMLDVSKIEQGRIDIKAEKTNPVSFISEIVSSFQPVAKNKNLQLTFKHTLNSEKIFVDQNRFRQVLVNIIGNAIKYTPKGEVKVRVSTERGLVSIRVIDSGIGISAEDQKKLFQKFHRVSSMETAEIRGTGLGLWITKQIVELMNGKITVESIKGVGSHFIVEFPVV